MTEQLTPATSDAPSTSLARGMIKAVRPKQWAKNVLVFVAPGAAGVLLPGSKTDVAHEVFRHNPWPGSVLQTIGAFAVFCAASAGTYLLNDVIDVESDRRHPKKRHRPIAAGIVPIGIAVATSIVLIVGAVAAAFVRNWHFAAVVAAYVVLTTAYSMWMKQQAVLDLVGLSSGFILRLLGGAYATDVAITDWFLIIACFGSLFIATCKRAAEKRELGEDSGSIRATLGIYTESYLNFLKSVSAGVVLVSYCLFAVERAKAAPSAAIWIELSILPFVVAILRYALLVEMGEGSAPEELILGDRQLIAVGVVWAILMGVSLYVPH